MGIVRGMARTAVVAGTATAVSNNVSRRQANRWAEQSAEEQQQAQAQAVPQSQPAPDPQSSIGDSDVAQLEQLAKLKDDGIITQEEFDAKKKQILGL